MIPRRLPPNAKPPKPPEPINPWDAANALKIDLAAAVAGGDTKKAEALRAQLERITIMDDQPTTSALPVSLEDLASRLTALEAATTAHTAFLHEFETDVGQTFQQMKAIVQASARVGQSAVVPRPEGAGAAAPKKDAWGNPLDADGKVVALPAPKPPAPAPVAGQAPACSCDGHEPDHGPNGCRAKGCICPMTP
jgi:hypothetical protein